MGSAVAAMYSNSHFWPKFTKFTLLDHLFEVLDNFLALKIVFLESRRALLSNAHFDRSVSLKPVKWRTIRWRVLEAYLLNVTSLNGLFFKK